MKNITKRSDSSFQVKKPEKITATDLQNAASGRFRTAQSKLEKMHADMETNQHHTPEQPDWFKDPVEKNSNYLGKKLWNLVYQNMKKSEHTIKENLEEKAKKIA